MIKLFRSQDDYILQNSDQSVRVPKCSIDELFRRETPREYLDELMKGADVVPLESKDICDSPLQPPVESQEIWAAGVTYYRSRSARMEESESSGGDRFYDLVYDADRPELFFKSTGQRVRGHRDYVCIRSDSTWDVPEPELTLAINQYGKLFGFTVGNDMSSRSIEGENPLYLPQAKIYRGSAAIGPCLLVADTLEPTTEIKIAIERAGEVVFQGATQISQIKRSFDELIEFLFRDNEFPNGVLLMTGTGVVPDSGFTLMSNDVVEITIDPIGTLVNIVE